MYGLRTNYNVYSLLSLHRVSLQCFEIANEGVYCFTRAYYNVYCKVCTGTPPVLKNVCIYLTRDITIQGAGVVIHLCDLMTCA